MSAAGEAWRELYELSGDKSLTVETRAAYRDASRVVREAQQRHQETTMTRTPNIRSIDPHTECWRQEHAPASYGRGPTLGLPGDVRRCRHGIVQVLEEPHVNSTLQGPGMRWWRDLHPFWNRRLYKRAAAALEAAELPSGVVRASKP